MTLWILGWEPYIRARKATLRQGRAYVTLTALLLLLAGCRPDARSTTIVTPLPPTSAPTASSVPATSEAMNSVTVDRPATSTPATATAPASPTTSPTAMPTHTAEPIPEAIVEVPGALLPPGFSMIKFADLYRPTSLTFDADGRLYATSFDGTIHRFADEDGDGRADQDTIFSNGFAIPLGITVRPDNGAIYVSSNGKISVLRDAEGDGIADEAIDLVNNLPTGLHQNDNLKFGPDGMLYMGIGSTCDACEETDPRSATIMRFDPESGEGEVIAHGLRNPYDLAFHPVTGDLFATDNGRDGLGLDVPGEELNHIRVGAHYGWPDCWDYLDGINCDNTVPAVAFFEPHASANSLDFYPATSSASGRFPAEYAANAFVAIFGSWLKSGVTTGIQRVHLIAEEDTYQGDVEWFARWDGMPLGLIIGPDGALYVGDYKNGAIYRISYR